MTRKEFSAYWRWVSAALAFGVWQNSFAAGSFVFILWSTVELELMRWE